MKARKSIVRLVAVVAVVAVSTMVWASEQFFQVNPAGTYLRTNQDPAGSPTSISLEEYGIEPGDVIGIRSVGSFQWNSGGVNNGTTMLGVFSSSSTLLGNQFLVRVPDAITYGTPFMTTPTFNGGLLTDIPQDFVVPSSGMEVVVPPNARFLFLSGHDNFYADNVDPDGDFGVMVDLPILINSNTTIPKGEDFYTNKRLKIKGATVTINGSHTLKSLVLSTGAVVTTAAGNPLNLTVTSAMTIVSGASINLRGRGFGPGQGPGAGFPIGTGGFGSGGSHAGRGQSAPSQLASYGSYLQPTTLGSGGGGTRGLAGGGALRLTVGGQLTCNGQINADGAGDIWDTVAGAGGSVWLSVGSLTGSGSVRASGGNGPFGVSAGGGRIAIIAGTSSFAGTVSAAGGATNTGGGGGPGTIYRQVNGQIPELIIDNEGVNGEWSNISEINHAGSLVLRNRANLYHLSGQAGLTINVTGNVTIDNTSSINVNGQGFGPGQGPGAGFAIGTSGGGAGGSHAGRGGNSFENLLPYGSITQPVTLGSGGGGSSGQAGGGAIRLSAGGTFSLNGSLQANGDSGPDAAQLGKGSGGSIWITANAITGSGSIQARGGGGGGNGGGGGRIAIETQGDTFSGVVRANGGVNTGTGIPGGPGTIYRKVGSQRASLIFDNDGIVGSALTLLPGLDMDVDMIIRNGATLSHAISESGIYWTIGGNLVVESTGAIDVSGRGFWDNSGPGRGFTLDASNRGSGGGYGGRGGRNGGQPYGSATQPVDLGSGGGGAGSRGGGAVRLEVAGTLTLNGFIRSNGLNSNPGGAGSGGSIWIIANTFMGNGVLQAAGGNVSDGNSGAGGGGRIAINAQTDTFLGVAVAPAGGSGASAGQPGTVFRPRVTGTATLNDYQGSTEGRMLQVQVWQNGNLVESLEAPFGANGTYYIAPTVNGVATLRFKFRSSLWKSVNVTLGSGLLSANVALVNGDVDGSGEVDAADIDAVIAQFGSTADILADVDGSGEVDAADIDIVIGNFGATDD